MKPERIGQALLAVVAFLAIRTYIEHDSAEPTRYAPPAAYSPPEPVAKFVGAVEQATGSAKFACLEVHLNSGEVVSECQATILECESRASYLRGVAGKQGNVTRCETTHTAYAFAVKDGAIETAGILVQNTMQSCESRRRIELKNRKADDVTPCVEYKSPDELLD